MISRRDSFDQEEEDDGGQGGPKRRAPQEGLFQKSLIWSAKEEILTREAKRALHVFQRPQSSCGHSSEPQANSRQSGVQSGLILM